MPIFELLLKTLVNIKTLEINVPVNYGDEDIPHNFPGRRGKMLNLVIDLEFNQILNYKWHEPFDLYMKVVDGGIYTIKGDVVGGQPFSETLENDYVPRFLGDYGDYISLHINEKGFLKNLQFDPKPWLNTEK